MGKPVFTTEKRSVRRFVGLPAIEKVAFWPTVDAILAEFRKPSQDISDHVTLHALNGVLTEAMFAGDYFAVYGALGKMLGLHGHDGKLTTDGLDYFHLGKSLPVEEVKPPREHSTSVSDAEARRMLGRTKTPV